MKITIVGAAGGEVTGSAYYVQAPHANVLVDCGQFQGSRQSDALNRWKPPARIKVDAVLVTHGHLDHVGRLPLLVKRGHRMPIYATEATLEMAALILRDSARIMAGDTARKNLKLARAGEPPVEPLYTPEDAEGAIRLMKPVPYQQEVAIAPGIRAIWTEAGHMLGSASIKLIVEEDGRQKKVVFSGDLGPKSAPILKTYEPFHTADMVFIESTYGSRDHRPFDQTVAEFVAAVTEAIASGGKMLVPTFAVGRAQLITGLLGWMFRTGKARPFPIFLDSPMAIDATDLMGRHVGDHRLDRETCRKAFSLARCTDDVEASKAISANRFPKIVISASGMATGGRVLHHLKAFGPDPKNTVLLAGFQAVGTRGHSLQQGAKDLKIHGMWVPINAEVAQIDMLSAHADSNELMRWLSGFNQPKRVFIVHGEPDASEALRVRIERELSWLAVVPRQEQEFVL